MDVNKELEELFNDPLLGVTYDEAKLFDIPADMKRVMERKRLQPDHYAQKKVCEDFHLFKPLFDKVQKELKEGKRSLMRIGKTSSMLKGSFFVIGGQLVYLAEIGETKRAANGLKDARTRTIYDNGTEADILLQTLRKNVVEDGYGVTEPQENVDSKFFNATIEDGDKATGFIYILRSLSPNPEIANVENLYKIGFTTNSVEERVANAEHEPTYLMAPGHIVATAQIVNMNSHVFEGLVHQFFSAVQFQVIVYDEKGEAHVPSEWYVAPLEIIEKVIEKISDGSITQYSYNAELQKLEKRIVKKQSTFDVSGLKVLSLIIKDVYFKQILDGTKTIEYRELKQTTMNKYTYIDEADGKRYLRRYDALRLLVGYNKERDSALVEVTDITFDKEDSIVEFHLGRILETI